jgi:hypothetical protein
MVESVCTVVGAVAYSDWHSEAVLVVLSAETRGPLVDAPPWVLTLGCCPQAARRRERLMATEMRLFIEVLLMVR